MQRSDTVDVTGESHGQHRHAQRAIISFLPEAREITFAHPSAAECRPHHLGAAFEIVTVVPSGNRGVGCKNCCVGHTLLGGVAIDARLHKAGDTLHTTEGGMTLVEMPYGRLNSHCLGRVYRAHTEQYLLTKP